MKIMAVRDTHRIYIHDGKRKKMQNGADVLKKFPTPEKFRKYLHADDTIEEFDYWIGSIKNDKARLQTYQMMAQEVWLMAIREAQVNGKYKAPPHRKRP